MVTGHPPFHKAIHTDPIYKCIGANRGDLFWKIHGKNKPGGEAYFSEEFKDICLSLLQLYPERRPTMAQVLAHPWMKGPQPTYEEMCNEFTKRH